MLAGVIVLAGLTTASGGRPEIAGMSARALGAIVYVGAFASGLDYLLYTFSIARLGPTRTSSVVYWTVSLRVALLALATLGEPITAESLANIALVIAGLLLLTA